MAPVVPDRPRTPGAPRPAGPLPRRRTAGPGHLPGITGVPGLLAPGRPAGPALVALRAGRASGTGHRHLYFFQAEDGIRHPLVTGVRRVLFRSRAELLRPAGNVGPAAAYNLALAWLHA